jgi:DNA-binding response OmpR family regulator
LDDQRSVLIVDPSEETREVLRTALERRGVRIFSACRAKQGLELARNHHPDLIVLDLELDFDGEQIGQANASNPENRCNPFAEQSRADQTPLVMLGTVRRGMDRLPEGEFVAKPYHYGPLIRRIEELLATSPE